MSVVDLGWARRVLGKPPVARPADPPWAFQADFFEARDGMDPIADITFVDRRGRREAVVKRWEADLMMKAALALLRDAENTEAGLGAPIAIVALFGDGARVVSSIPAAKTATKAQIGEALEAAASLLLAGREGDPSPA